MSDATTGVLPLVPTAKCTPFVSCAPETQSCYLDRLKQTTQEMKRKMWQPIPLH